jgi:4a-hydroxytetrahydrobiopterin dehydratase
MTGRITARQFHEAAGVGDWRVLGEAARTYFRTGSFEAGARLVQAIAELGCLDDHPPDVDLRHEGVTVRLITIADGYYGLSERDVELGGSRRWRASSAPLPTRRRCRASRSRSTRSFAPR